MRPPTPEQQLLFLANVQRLLDEGSFVATYKYALLLALADLSVEQGDESGDALPLATADIAEKFVDYYWRQAVPYPAPGRRTAILQQNTGRQANIVNKVARARDTLGGSLSRARMAGRDWHGLVSDVDRVVQIMPLWKLQTIAGAPAEFLYRNQPEARRVERIVLLPGVAANFRRFHGLIRALVQEHWARFVRQLAPNQAVLGQNVDLVEFLFGSERERLDLYRPVLQDAQSNECFYCLREIRGASDVDHFIPWTKYPVDLGHNFVLAHPACNRAKQDYLAAERHLGHWRDHIVEHGAALAHAFDHEGLVHDQATSSRVAEWSYGQAERAGARVWVEGKILEALSPRWRIYLSW